MMQNFTGVQFVFLDRDGVINRKAPEGVYVSRWADFDILPGVEEAIRSCNAAGQTVIVVTNQRGIALGRYGHDDLTLLHAQLQEHLSQSGAHIDGFYYCPHDKEECDCRKPKAGLFHQAFRDFPDATPSNSIMIGDSLSDIQAAESVGIPTIFIDGNPETQGAGADLARATAGAACASLAEAMGLLMKATAG